MIDPKVGEPGRETVRAVVSADLDGLRGDRVVAALFGLTRSAARTIVDAGEVTVSGAPLAPSQRLSAGDSVEATLPPVEPELVPVPVLFEVRFQDPALIIVDKPPGLVVHPARGTRDPTLIAGLAHRFPELLDLSASRWGLVHRLDRDTSGLLTVARTTEAHTRLLEAMKRREIARRYLTLVTGVPEAGRGTVDAPIGRDPRHPTRQAVTGDGRPARTHYRRLAAWEDVALLEVTLETGRTHQIRVHLTSVGHPVVGDAVYGRQGRGSRPRREGVDPGRQWLHATNLEFDHPIGGGRIIVGSPLPSDLAASLEALGPPRSGVVPD